jgi:ssDNA-binding replication factor A large subunit
MDLADLNYQRVRTKDGTDGLVIWIDYLTNCVSVEVDGASETIYHSSDVELIYAIKVREFVQKLHTLPMDQQTKILYDILEGYYRVIEGEWSDGDSKLRSIRALVGLK